MLERTFSDGGSSGFILPKGCKSIEDCPVDFVNALHHAHMVNTWHANYPAHEVPPRWMWPFEDELDQWFTEVKLAREQGSNEDSVDDMMVNEYAEGLR